MTYLGLVVAGLLLVASGTAFGIRGLMTAGATIAAFGALNTFVVTVVVLVLRSEVLLRRAAFVTRK